MRRVFKEIKTQDLNGQIRYIWYSKDTELEKQEFDGFPIWMEDSDPQDEIKRESLEVAIHEQLLTLTTREQTILYMRFWQEMSLEEVGLCFRVTGQRIRQIEAKALRKLRHPSRSDHLSEYALWEGQSNSKPFQYPQRILKYLKKTLPPLTLC